MAERHPRHAPESARSCAAAAAVVRRTCARAPRLRRGHRHHLAEIASFIVAHAGGARDPARRRPDSTERVYVRAPMGGPHGRTGGAGGSAGRPSPLGLRCNESGRSASGREAPPLSSARGSDFQPSTSAGAAASDWCRVITLARPSLAMTLWRWRPAGSRRAPPALVWSGPRCGEGGEAGKRPADRPHHRRDRSAGRSRWGPARCRRTSTTGRMPAPTASLPAHWPCRNQTSSRRPPRGIPEDAGRG